MKRSNYAFRQCPLALFSNLRQLENFLNCFVACVASVSVLFRSKERGARVKDRAKNGASKRGGGWQERKETFLPLPLPLPPPLSFFGSRFVSRAAKTENPVQSVFLCSETARIRLLRRLNYFIVLILHLGMKRGHQWYWSRRDGNRETRQNK